ncbi:pentatricopeptide repeat-containing protein At1g33350 [Nymphaea colorata]|uniref:pentatricopeptide repeat-containing protein At1g33350 n=1 Tax=Nymphaea colorata TaxID=210225 RepID=UPI00214E494E|nr:pentatricopeptide repeat-containing protein At1g33350 [Nymphaea colorata]
MARQLFDEMSERNVISWTAMVFGYTKFGRMGEAVLLFDNMPVRDPPSWNAMIAGFAQNGMFGDAVSMFRRMVVEGYRPNETTVVCTLSACGHLGTLQIGEWVHGFVHKSGIGSSCFVGNALIDMYGKCGSLKEARSVFDFLSLRSIASWNSLVNGLALHGYSSDAIAVFREMLQTGAKPDEITFVGVLNACVHGGMVNEGWEFFLSINRDYGIKLQIQHYGCIVDLLGRAGKLEEAVEVIKNMEVEPDEVVWGALLSGCRVHGNRSLADYSATQLLDLDPQNAAYLLLLANMYSESGRWEDVGKTRKMIRERGVLKTPGCSWIEIENIVHEFYSADKQHPQAGEICEALESLLLFSKDLGNYIDMNSLNCDST